MSAIATAIVGGAVVGGVASSKAAGKQAKSAKKGIAEQRRQYDQTRQDYEPFRLAGVNALKRLEDPAANFQADPGYQFIRDESFRDIGNQFAAKGSGGNALRALQDRGANLANTTFNDWWNRQLSLTGMGQAATSSTAMAGANAASNIQQGFNNIGDARASGVAGVANSVIGGVGNYLYGRGAGLFDSGAISEIPASAYAPRLRSP